MHGQRVPIETPEPGFVAQGGKLIVTRTLQGIVKLAGLGKVGGKARAHNGAARDAQRVFQCGIGKQDLPLTVNHGDQRCQQIKRLKSQRCRDCQGRHGARVFYHQFFACGGVEVVPMRASSRRMLARSLSPRVKLAFNSATLSWYFWGLRVSSLRMSGAPCLYSLLNST